MKNIIRISLLTWITLLILQGIAASQASEVRSDGESQSSAIQHAYPQVVLAYAVHNGLEVVRSLLDSGLDVNQSTESGVTALHEASRLSMPEMVAFLIERGAQVNARDGHGSTPLYYAIGAQGSAEDSLIVVRLLLKAGGDLSIFNAGKFLVWTPRTSYRRGLFTSSNVSVYKRYETPLGYTPFMLAVLDMRDLFLNELIEHALHSGSKNSFLLHQVAWLDHPKVFYKIYKSGVRLDEMNDQGWMPLHIFAVQNNIIALSELIGEANALGDHDFVKECIRQSYALVVVPDQEITCARKRAFDFLRTLQVKCKFPPYIVVQLLHYLPELDDDLCNLLLKELVAGNPSSSIVLSSAKEVLAGKLARKFEEFFSKALRDHIVITLNQLYSNDSLVPTKLDQPWLKANIESLILEGIRARFKQLSDRANSLRAGKVQTAQR